MARTARIPHECDSCYWTHSLRGVPTILPGHRYLIHTAFPGDPGYEEGEHPARLKECATHAISRDDFAATQYGICATYCCGTEPCVLQFQRAGAGHEHRHVCHRCSREQSEQAPVDTATNLSEPREGR